MRQYLGKGTNYMNSKMYSRAQTLTKKISQDFFFIGPLVPPSPTLWLPIPNSEAEMLL